MKSQINMWLVSLLIDPIYQSDEPNSNWLGFIYTHNTIEAKKLWLLVANVLNLRIVQSSCKRDYSVLA